MKNLIYLSILTYLMFFSCSEDPIAVQQVKTITIEDSCKTSNLKKIIYKQYDSENMIDMITHSYISFTIDGLREEKGSYITPHTNSYTYDLATRSCFCTTDSAGFESNDSYSFESLEELYENFGVYSYRFMAHTEAEYNSWDKYQNWYPGRSSEKFPIINGYVRATEDSQVVELFFNNEEYLIKKVETDTTTTDTLISTWEYEYYN